MAVRQMDLIQDTLDLLILNSLASAPNHGYRIAMRIHQLFNDVLRVEEAGDTMAVTCKKRSFATLFALCRSLIGFLLIFAIVLLLTAARSGPPSRDRMVVLISIDGLPGFSFDDPRLPAPTLRRLAAEGAHARRMLTIGPSVTWPSHTSIM